MTGRPPLVIDFIEVWAVFQQTFWQASLSALLSLGFGFFIALGLLNLRSPKMLLAYEWFFISPQILPSLFILLSVYQLYALFETAPAGFLDVVIAHVIINAGFCGVQLARLFKTKVGGYAELAQVEGASAALFFKTTLPYLTKELLQLYFTVFVFCFISFSIPLVIGGPASETLEVLIYKKMIAGGQFASALFICAVQFVALALVGGALNWWASDGSQLTRYRTIRYGSWHLLILPSIFVALLYYFSLRDFLSGVGETWQQAGLYKTILIATLGSLVTGFSAGGAVLLLALLLTYISPQRLLSRVLLVLTPPSFVFVGLLLFLAGWVPTDRILAFVVLGSSLAVLFFLSLYRYGLASLIDGLSQQTQVAQALGSSRGLIFKSILLPQLFHHFCYFAGIAAFWAVGDFALSLFVVPIESNLALFVKMLLSRYKLEMATAVIWWMLALGCFIFLFFKGVGRVVSQRLN